MIDPLQDILASADLPSRQPDPALPQLLRSIATRRKRTKAALLAVALFTPALLLLLRSSPTPPRPNTTALAAEAEQYRFEAESRMRVVQRMLALEKRAPKSSLPDPVMEVQSQQDRAALILLDSADRQLTRFHRPDTASAEYRRILDLFPNTHSASVARQRLQHINL